jgi:ribosomal protein L11 methyltransferase
LSWVELRLIVARRRADLVSHALFELGAVGCQEDYLSGEQPPVRQPWDTGPPPPEPDRTLLRAYWNAQDAESAREALPEVLSGLSCSARPDWVDVEEDDWAEGWRNACERVVVSDTLVISPPWKAEAGDLLIEPGMAFGSGEHPTTVSCLRAIEVYAVAGKRCLDVGTGSGVLAIAAARLGMDAWGIDIDPESQRAALENAGLNKVQIRADLTPLESVTDRFELVVANLFAEVLVALAGDLKRVTAGNLAVAGVLSDRADTVIEALRPMRLLERDLEGDWCHMRFGW